MQPAELMTKYGAVFSGFELIKGQIKMSSINLNTDVN